MESGASVEETCCCGVHARSEDAYRYSAHTTVLTLLSTRSGSVQKVLYSQKHTERKRGRTNRDIFPRYIAYLYIERSDFACRVHRIASPLQSKMTFVLLEHVHCGTSSLHINSDQKHR